MRTLLIGAVLLLLVAGCAKEVTGVATAGGRPPATTTTTTTTTTAAPAPAEPSTPPAATAPTQPTQTKQPAQPAVCTVGDLTVSLGASEGTAGTMYRALVFTNSGDRTCVIQGFPGVSFVAGDDGHQVGAAAVRSGAKGGAVILKPGATATAPVGFRDAGLFDPAVCEPTDVRGLRVYPPHERKAEFVPFATQGCAGAVPGGQLIVATVHAGSGLESG